MSSSGARHPLSMRRSEQSGWGLTKVHNLFSCSLAEDLHKQHKQINKELVVYFTIGSTSSAKSGEGNHRTIL